MYSTFESKSIFFSKRSDARGWRNACCGKSRGKARAWWREWHHSRYGVGMAIRGTTVVVPTAGFHEEAATPAAAPPRPVVSPRGWCARTCRSIYPWLFSWLDAFVVRRRSSGYLDSCRSVVATPTTPNFADLSSTAIELPTGWRKRRVHQVPARVSGAFRDRQICTSRSFARGAFVASQCVRINVYRDSAVLHRRSSDSALSILTVKMVRSDDVLVLLCQSVEAPRLFNVLCRE